MKKNIIELVREELINICSQEELIENEKVIYKLDRFLKTRNGYHELISLINKFNRLYKSYVSLLLYHVLKETLNDNIEDMIEDKAKYDKFLENIPSTFTIETSLACNLKCPECAIGGGMISRKKGFISYKQAEEIANKIKPYAKYVYLHLWGEPTLNKDIYDIIKLFSTFSRTNISTNATMLNEDTCEKLIKSGVSDLIISVDGFSQSVYQKYRVGGDIKKVKENIENLVKYNQEYGNYVSIMPQFIVFKHNQEEIEYFKNYCNNLGLEAFFKAPYIRNDDTVFELSDYDEYKRTYYKDDLSLKEAMKDCINPKEVFTMNVDGSCIICCHDFNKHTNYGNIFDDDVLDIWFSPKYMIDRWNILNGKPLQFCIDNCMTYMKDSNYKENQMKNESELKVNLCSGPRKLKEYVNIDISPNSDIILDLEKELLPFEDNSVDILVCMSAINYFDFARGYEIIKDVYRVLKPGGITRFGVQDLELLAKYYIEKNDKFFNEKLANGKDRFPGVTLGDKFNQWFYGFETGGKYCKYVYDYETLKYQFERAGFEIVERKDYLESNIENIEDIDNRPEQMFFLEATKKEKPKRIKGNIDFNDEYEWNKFLENYYSGNYSKTDILNAIQKLQSIERYNDMVMLISEISEKYPDKDLIALKNKLMVLNQQYENEKVKRTPSDIMYLNKVSKKYDDIKHLEEIINWLKKAYEATNNKGVSAGLDLLKNKWLVAYPETTGYIIPTFIEASEVFNDSKLLESAKEMGLWEISIQWENGGIGEPIGVFGQKPRIFNTAQVMIGLLSLYQKLNNKEFLDSAIKSGNWIIQNQQPTGEWEHNTYRGPRTYHSRVAWILYELYNITGDKKYQEASLRFLDWLLSKSDGNGWFFETSLSEPDKPWSHLYAYTIYGLVKLLKKDLPEYYKDHLSEILKKSAGNLINQYNQLNKPYICFPGNIVQDFDTNYNWSCLTGNAQISSFFFEMYEIFNDNDYLQIFNESIEELKKVHLVDSFITDEKIRGALAGSFPIEGDYCQYTLPNWSAKFFADSLMLKLNKSSSTSLLG